LTSLDISSNNLVRGSWTNYLGNDHQGDNKNFETDLTGVTTLANAIKDMGALTKLDISNNQIGWLVHLEWSDTGQGGSYRSGERYQHIDGRKQDEKPEGVEFKPLGVVAVATAIKDMGALTKLDLSSNNIGREDREQQEKAVEVLLESYGTSLQALKDHFEKTSDDSKAAVVNMVFCMSYIYQRQILTLVFRWQIVAAIEKAKVVCSDDIKAKLSACFASAGAIALADAIRDMRAISSVNLLKNNIPVEQAQELVKIMQSKEKLVTLCGLSKEETELDFSGQDLGAGEVVLIANDISDMRALSSLNLASNNLCGLDVIMLEPGIYANPNLRKLDLSNNSIDSEGVGVILSILERTNHLKEVALEANPGMDPPECEQLTLADWCTPVKAIQQRYDCCIAKTMLCGRHPRCHFAHGHAQWPVTNSLPVVGSFGWLPLWELLHDLFPPCQRSSPAVEAPSRQLVGLIKEANRGRACVTRWSILLLCAAAASLPLAVPTAENGSTVDHLQNSTCNFTVAHVVELESGNQAAFPSFVQVAYARVCNASSMSADQVELIVEDFVDPVSGFALVIVATLVWMVFNSRVIPTNRAAREWLLGAHCFIRLKDTPTQQLVQPPQRWESLVSAVQVVVGKALRCCFSDLEAKKGHLKQYLAKRIQRRQCPHVLKKAEEALRANSSSDMKTMAALFADQVEQEVKEAMKEGIGAQYGESSIGKMHREGAAELRALVEEETQRLTRSKSDRALYLLVHLLAVCFALGQHLAWSTHQPNGSGFLCQVAARGTLAIFFKPILPSMWYGLAHMLDQEGWMLEHNLVTDTVVLLVWLLFACWFALAFAVSAPLVYGCFVYLGLMLAVPFLLYQWVNRELLWCAKVNAQGERFIRMQGSTSASKQNYKAYEEEERRKSLEERHKRVPIPEEEWCRREAQKGRDVKLEKIAKDRNMDPNELRAAATTAGLIFNRLLGYTIIGTLVFGIPLWPFYSEPTEYIRILRDTLSSLNLGIVFLFDPDFSFLKDLFRWPTGMELPSRISLAVSLTALAAENFIWLWRYVYFMAVGPSFHGGGARADDLASENLEKALAELAKVPSDQSEAGPGKRVLLYYAGFLVLNVRYGREMRRVPLWWGYLQWKQMDTKSLQIKLSISIYIEYAGERWGPRSVSAVCTLDLYNA
jgi:Leucine-rich repeat (LRR) protein